MDPVARWLPIAGLLAGGMEIADAVKAQEYTWQTLKAGFRPVWASLFRSPVLGSQRRQ